MKRLICEKDIVDLIHKGEKTLWIDSNTIITPSAKDAARANKIEISHGCGCADVKEPCKEVGVDSETIYLALKAMIEQTLNGR